MASKYRQTVETTNCVVNERKKIVDSKVTQSLSFANFRYAFLLLGVLESMAVLALVACKCSRVARRWTPPVKMLRIKMPPIKKFWARRKATEVLPARVLPAKVLSARVMPPARRRLPVRKFPKMPSVKKKFFFDTPVVFKI